MRVAVDPAGDQQQAALQRFLGDAVRELLGRLLRGRVGDELDREHRAEAAYLADLGPALLPGEHPRADRLADRGRALEQPLVLDHVEHRQRGREGDRVADVGAADAADDGRVHDLGPAEHARERQAVGDRLRDADQVGLDARVLDPEEPAGAAEARLHLVDDQDDPVAVADRADTFDELGRRDDEPAFALHRLEHDRGDALGPDRGRECLLERAERVLGRHAAVGVRERHPVDLGRERAEARLVGVHLRGERQREQRAPVERALERDHRRAARVGARELDGVLDGLGAGVEERGLDRPRDRHALAQALGELRVRLVGDDREIGVGEPVELLVRRRDDIRVAVPDVQAADPAGEVDERVPVDVGQRRAPRGGGHDRERDRERPRDVALDPLPDLLRPRPRNLGDEVDHTRRSHRRSVANTPERPDSGALAGSRFPAHNPAPPPRVGMPTRHPQCQFYEVGGAPCLCQVRANFSTGRRRERRPSGSAAHRETLGGRGLKRTRPPCGRPLPGY